jgi:hypothetical protein
MPAPEPDMAEQILRQELYNYEEIISSYEIMPEGEEGNQGRKRGLGL